MKKMRFTALAAAAAMTLTFTSCGDSSGSGEESENGVYYDNNVSPATEQLYEESSDGNDYKYVSPSEEKPAADNDGKAGLQDSEEEVCIDEVAEVGYVGYERTNSTNSFSGGINETIAETATAVTVAPAMDAVYYGNYFIPGSEEYAEITENGFTSVAEKPLSTFSADVDTASYTNIRRVLNNGGYPYSDMVRIEEIMNYFDYDYTPPKGNEPFSVTTQLSDCPWAPENQLMLVGIQAAETDAVRLPMNLVFLIDVSGSMFDNDKLPLIQQAFTMLANELDENDRISIVTYAGSDAVVLEGEKGSNTKAITDAINSLSAGGATAGGAGIKTAYKTAEKYFIENGNNRVILATDGDLNVGASSVEDLTDLIEQERESGVFLSVLGVGEGNLKDDRLEALADNGNGNYSYIDCLSEAKKVLIEELNATLVTVAKDVKFQVEFNPANIAGYRLIGYENRVLADRDFNDDTKDAGEVGAGSSVTVLYELITVEATEKYAPEYKYSENIKETPAPKPESDKYSDELLTVNIRCKAPDKDESELYNFPVRKSLYSESMPKELNFAACCAEFGMLLRNSENKGSSSWRDILDMLDNYDYSDDEYKTEFEYLVRSASNYNGY